MAISLLESIVSECQSHRPYIWIDYMGEPTLHPQFIQIIDLLNRYDIPFAMESNATLWNEDIINCLAKSKMDKIIVTLEPNSQLFLKYRSVVDFDGVISALKEFVKRREGNTKLELQMIVHTDNNALVSDFKQLCMEIGADKSFVKPIMIHQFEGNGAYKNKLLSNLWSKDIVSRYVVNDDGEVSLPVSAMKSTCPKLEETVILADGQMVMCCYDKQGKYRLGDIRKHTLEELWNLNADFRNTKMRSRSFDFCKYCIENSYEDMIIPV